MGKTPARQIGWRIGFLPSNIVYYFEAFLFKSHSNTVNIMKRSADPNASVYRKGSFAESNPLAVKLMFFLQR
jgi:hypothetical protein